MPRQLLGFVLGLAAGFAAALLWSGPRASADRAVPQASTVGTAEPAPGPAPAASAATPSADDEAQQLRQALASERLHRADLEGQLDEVRSAAARATAAGTRLEGPRRWLEALMPDKFSGLTAQQLAHSRELDLSDSNLDVHDLAYLGELPALRWLTLRGTATDDTGLQYLLRVGSLVRLGLRQTKVTDAGMPVIGAMKKLEYLDLNMLPITDAGLAAVRGMPELTFLRLNYTKVTDAGMQHVATLRKLARLDLWGTAVTDRGLEQVRHLPVLKHLELGATAVSRQWVQRFQAEHPECFVRAPGGE